jgi:hypothetical protein
MSYGTHLGTSDNIQHAMAALSIIIKLHPRPTAAPIAASGSLWPASNATPTFALDRLMDASTAVAAFEEILEAVEVADLVSDICYAHVGG